MRLGGASAAGAGEREFVVDVLAGYGRGVELGGVFKAEPFEHLLMALVVWVGEDFFQIGVSPGAAAVLGWQAPLAATRIG